MPLWPLNDGHTSRTHDRSDTGMQIAMRGTHPLCLNFEFWATCSQATLALCCPCLRSLTPTRPQQSARCRVHARWLWRPRLLEQQSLTVVAVLDGEKNAPGSTLRHFNKPRTRSADV